MSKAFKSTQELEYLFRHFFYELNQGQEELVRGPSRGKLVVLLELLSKIKTD